MSKYRRPVWGKGSLYEREEEASKKQRINMTKVSYLHAQNVWYN